jgi:TDG/mug DNA glycosylase family protein
VPRATSGINDLAPADYAAGRFVLERKIRRLRPRVVALVGITLAYALVRDASAPAARNVRRRRARNANRESAGRPLGIGPRNETLGGRPVFVLPNPSGRNANFTYAEMLAAFVALRRWLEA